MVEDRPRRGVDLFSALETPQIDAGSQGGDKVSPKCDLNGGLQLDKPSP